jgi:hypothetical protein
MNLEDIKENYRNFDDSDIERIATADSSLLEPEVLEILKAEIQRRNLDLSLVDSVDAQTKELSIEEFNEYCSILRNHTCPNCNSSKQNMNASMVGKVTSVVIWTSYEKSMKVACSDCLDKFHDKAITNSLLLGWWAIPWGPIQTV